MDKNSGIPSVFDILGCTELPAAVIKGEEIWENPGFKKLFAFSGEDVKRTFFSDLKGKKGIQYEKLDKKIYKVNIITVKDFRIIEVLSSDDLLMIISSPEIRGYLKYILAHVRTTVNEVNLFSNTLYNLLSADDPFESAEKIISGMNALEKRMVYMLGGIIDAEQFALLLDENTEDTTVSVTECVDCVVKDIIKIYDEKLNIESDHRARIYSRMNGNSLRVIVTDILWRMCGGKYEPDKITVKTGFCGKNAEVIIISDCSSMRPQNRKLLPKGKAGYYGELFFKYMCEVFCKRYGGEFIYKEVEDGTFFRISFNAVYQEYVVFSAPRRYMPPVFYDIVNLRFSRKERFALPVRKNEDKTSEDLPAQ